MTRHIYKIRVEGLLGENWKSWFEGLTIQHLDCGQTLLTAPLDQSMLRGILAKIGDLGLELVSVQQLEQDGSGKKKEVRL